MVITSYAIAIAILFCSGLPALFGGSGPGAARGEKLSALLLAGGALLGFVAVCGVLTGGGATASQSWSIPGGHIVLRLDGLAAVFLLPAFLICGLGSIYGLGYWPQGQHGSAGRLRLFYGILAACIAALPATANSILFLVAWELMALACFFLILIEQEDESVRRAAFVYLVCAHIATLALYAFFVLLAQEAGSFDFPASGALREVAPATLTLLFLLALFGFGLKAGIMPFHVWLPDAHAAAPSHVSAVMSGVVIKMGIYGLVRMTSFFAHIPVSWGWTVLFLGVVSGVMGVVFAIAQHDIKRLLAYHSVENIGIILIGLGLAMLGRSYDNQTLIVLGLSGALLHVVNHGLFKALLFLSAGAIINATGSRQIDSYGGVLRRMPVTALCFIGGAVAICGLPPLNGFVSEWLVYLGLLKSMATTPAARVAFAAVAAPCLAMIGALAVACFVKVCGVAFLGEPRSASLQDVREAPGTITSTTVVLLGGCLLIGVWPGLAVPLLSQAVTAWGVTPPADCWSVLAPVGWITISALALIGLVAFFALWQQRLTAEGGKRPPTWGCGYAWPSNRMQYTATSFAQMLTGIWAWGLRTETKGSQPLGFFPGPAQWSDHTPDVVLDRLLYPLCRTGAQAAFKVRSFLQHGIIGVYLLYIALTLALLLCLTLWA